MKTPAKPFLYCDVETAPSQDPAVHADIMARFPLPDLDHRAIKADGRLKDPVKMVQGKKETDEEFAAAKLAAQDAIDADLANKVAAADADHAVALAKRAATIDEAYRKTALDGSTGHLVSIAYAFDEDPVGEQDASGKSLTVFTVEGHDVLQEIRDGEHELLTKFFANLEETLDEYADADALGAWNAAKPYQLANGRWQLNSTPDSSYVQTVDDKSAWLAKHAKQVREIPTLVAHHADFDIRFVWQRATALGVPVPPWWPVNASKYRDDQVQDTMTMWAGHGNRIGLDRLCRALGLDGKGEFDGSTVWDAVRAGKLAAVVDYNRGEVKRLRSVHRRLRGLKPMLIDIDPVAEDIYLNGGDLDNYVVGQVVAAVPLDFANAVDGNGNPADWEA